MDYNNHRWFEKPWRAIGYRPCLPKLSSVRCDEAYGEPFLDSLIETVTVTLMGRE